MSKYTAEQLAEFSTQDLIDTILELQECPVGKGSGRKEEVLKALTEHGPIAIQELADLLGINPRNVSSQLTYLRKDGVKIATKSDGRKFIEE